MKPFKPDIAIPQPIATAPRDGSRILLGGGTWGIVGGWDGEYELIQPVVGWWNGRQWIIRNGWFRQDYAEPLWWSPVNDRNR